LQLCPLGVQLGAAGVEVTDELLVGAVNKLEVPQ
jgi:hypothetical protein